MAGAPLAVAAIGVVVLSGLPVVAASGALTASQRLAAAADAAALAGGDALLGWTAGDPCAVAAHVAEANDAAISACRIHDLDIVVTVSATLLGTAVERTARAGPPPP